MSKIVTVLLFLSLSVNSFAQKENENKPIWGLSASVDFGRYSNRIAIEPSVSYQIIQKTYFGIGGSLLHYDTQNTIYQVENKLVKQITANDKIWYFGGASFVRFVPFEEKKTFIQNLFVQSSVEILKGKGKYKTEENRYTYTTENFTPFLSLGYKQPLSQKVNLDAVVAFKLNNEENSPYRNSVIRFGLQF